jgi:hypothetical protein
MLGTTGSVLTAKDYNKKGVPYSIAYKTKVQPSRGAKALTSQTTQILFSEHNFPF